MRGMKQLSATPNLNGGYPAVGKQPGRFFNKGDTRENLTKVVFDLEANSAIHPATTQPP
jgi:hypothetical protein